MRAEHELEKREKKHSNHFREVKKHTHQIRDPYITIYHNYLN